MPNDLETEGSGVLVDLCVSPDPASAAVARRALDRWRGRYGEDTLFKLRLLVSELVTNSVKHGRLEPGQSIGVRVTAGSDSVRVEVRDPGPGLPVPIRRADGAGWQYQQRAPDPDWPGGWGLSIVEAFADRWGVIHDGATRVWCEVSVD